MPKDRLLELRTGQAEIRSGLGNGNYAGSSTEQEDGKSKKKTSKKIRNNQKTIDDLFKEIQQIRAWLEAVEEETKLVKRLHSTILHSTRTEQDTKDKLMNAMIKIKTLSLRVRSSLKALEKQKEEKVSSVEGRMVSIQHSALSKRFQTAMADYQGALAHHKDQTEARIKAQLRIVIQTVMRRPAVLAGSNIQSADEIEALLDKETTQVFVDNYVHETQAMKLALQDAKIRHKEMMELEKSIRELHELFTDLSAMVHTQGEMINVIEYNVARGTCEVTMGNIEMSEAYTKKKSARRKKLWCFVLVMSIVGVILVYAALHTLVTSMLTF
ncbi:syntaxin-1A-like isoform X1 [Macrosteles quadrilineatus]|uniref:syntaxin-1A-like isoform X1 n=1 Tax=Macrosteles quadrilineatus TaxID=74068 RepID=UPI0023E25024|nr:syntaxin-1A-like isoform X1 [Macrosteles quadrilineatus]